MDLNSLCNIRYPAEWTGVNVPVVFRMKIKITKSCLSLLISGIICLNLLKNKYLKLKYGLSLLKIHEKYKKYIFRIIFYVSLIKNDTNKTRGSAHWACIAHLTIEWYWSKFQREIIITLKNSSHLEWRVGLSDTILKGTHPGTIYAKFGSIWPSCFRGEDFFNISQSEKRIILGGHVYRPNGTKWRNFIEDLT